MYTCIRCSVGTGLEDAERDRIRAQLERAGLIQAFDSTNGKVCTSSYAFTYSVSERIRAQLERGRPYPLTLLLARCALFDVLNLCIQ